MMFLERVGNIFLLLAVFVSSFLGTGVMRQIAKSYGWVAAPREDRWHKKPTALHGGVGFYPAFILGVVWSLTQTSGWNRVDTLGEIPLAVGLLIGSLIMFVFGLWDDLKQFHPVTKLLCQLLAASLFIFSGGIFPLTGIYAFDLLVTYFWFVGITNAVNMLDNMDGLSSGVVIIASLTVVALAIESQGMSSRSPLAVPFGLVLSMALLGFWVFNRPPASIFMGNSGSLFIGYVLAALSVPSRLNGFMGMFKVGGVLAPVLVLLIPTTILAIPIFDTTLVTITRKIHAQKASQGGKDHSSHRLVGLGLSEKRAVLTLYVLAGFGGFVAFFVGKFPDQMLPLLGVFILILLLTGIHLGHVKVQKAEPDKLPPVWTPLVSNILYKRHVGEVILDVSLIVICFYGAYLLRFEGKLSAETTQAIIHSLPIAVASCLCVFFFVGIYRSQWRLISVSDIAVCALGVFGGAVLSLAAVTLYTRFGTGHSRSAYLIFALLLFLTLVGSRLSFRLLDAFFLRQNSNHKSKNQKSILIYGAGKAGKLLLEEVMNNPGIYGYTMEGFIDDDADQVGRKLCGFPIKNKTQWLEKLWDKRPEIWVSSISIPDESALRLAEQFNGNVTVRRLKLQMEVIQAKTVNDLMGKVPKNDGNQDR
jgi:UDP-GlcNAc:undecaprenyl-phosphate GlcNAc-1-phosphate transferase